ncbi:Sap-like sulfolipid-1-addressing protein [Curtobacterium sp. PhB130]|uniref:GAP family protein n=1 Tax=unclassified Curtobacterium TaxID=257496 RepID=UPI000F4B17CF|nr:MULTISPECIES: GAP family protein [unclassified Curtobacterium]ROS75169.1 Sap-like sulfolipid-1-addressing protein [Curtobacterium sp. PhB130]TCK63794.1 Sap-like sulfolipid-1-addressing protein [Curtobacterium sp. PhB136]
MNAATLIGELLPQAVTIAISPIPVIAVIVMLRTPQASRVAGAFVGGWVLGVLLLLTTATILASAINTVSEDASRPIIGTLKILFGATLIALAIRQIRPHGATGSAQGPPPWLRTVEALKPWRTTGIGLALASVNPKNLLSGCAAGLTIGTSNAAIGTEVWTIGVFVAVASTTVAGPIVLSRILGRRADGPLDQMRVELSRQATAIMTVLFLISGVINIGRGIESF